MTFFRKRKKYRPDYRAIVDIAERYQDRWSPDIKPEIEDLYKHGEEGVAFELLIVCLYEDAIEPTNREKQVLTELGENMKFSEDDIFLWPDPPPRHNHQNPPSA